MPTQEESTTQNIAGMKGIDYATTGPLWDHPCRVGRFVETVEHASGAWTYVDTVVVGESSRPWACKDPREVASRCGVLIQGRTYRWLFHKITGDLVGWREEPLPKADTVSKHNCAVCGKEPGSVLCNDCHSLWNRVQVACERLARAKYGDSAITIIRQDDKSGVFMFDAGVPGVGGMSSGARTLPGVFEAMSNLARSGDLPSDKFGSLDGILDAIGEGAMELGLGIYGSEDR